MKHKRWFIGALILLIGFGGIAIAQQDMMPGQVQGQQPGMMQPQSPTSAIDQRFQMANEYLNQQKLNITQTPSDAFINGYILVAAEGLPKPDAVGPGQKRLTAERAAEVIAYRKLAEFLDGVAVVGDTLVKDAELQYDVVRAAVAG
ncbi:MAG: hypothetical protein Q8K51_16360, partial [Nitrospirota bacterium]|nr:hypothetical protein [Nitrospirota bacterium]